MGLASPSWSVFRVPGPPRRFLLLALPYAQTQVAFVRNVQHPKYNPVKMPPKLSC